MADSRKDFNTKKFTTSTATIKLPKGWTSGISADLKAKFFKVKLSKHVLSLSYFMDLKDGPALHRRFEKYLNGRYTRPQTSWKPVSRTANHR